MKKMCMAVVCVALLGVVAAGCGSPTTTSTTTPPTTSTQTTTTVPEPDYARAATDTTLRGLAERDLEKYTRHGNAEFKAAVTQEMLDAAAGPLLDQYGAFQGIDYLYTETQDPYTVVHYRAEFSEGEIGVRMIFDADNLIAGQWFE